MTFSNIIKRYLKETTLQQAPATLRNYTQRLEAYQKFVDTHDAKFDDRLTVMAWQKALLDSGLANSTVKQYMVELKTFFRWAIEQGRIKKNPTAGVKMPKPDAVHKEYLSVEESKKLLSASIPPPELVDDNNYFRNWIMLALALTSGIRLDSLVRLKVRDVDFSNGLIMLDKAKGGKSYPVPADDDVLRYVKLYIDSFRPQGLPLDASLFVRVLGQAEAKRKRKNDDVWAVGARLYAAMDGPNFSSRVCTKYTGMICGHAVTAHELRHSTAMYLLEKGISPQYIQQQLGHSSLIVTEKYLHGLRPSTVKAVTQNVWSTAFSDYY